MRVSEYECACVFKIFSETIGPTEAKFHVEPQWDRGRKFIQMTPVICCSSFEYCQPLGAGAFRRAFTTNVAPQSRAFSRALEIEKLKALLFRGPRGQGIQMTGALTSRLVNPRKRILPWFRLCEHYFLEFTYPDLNIKRRRHKFV